MHQLHQLSEPLHSPHPGAARPERHSSSSPPLSRAAPGSSRGSGAWQQDAAALVYSRQLGAIEMACTAPGAGGQH